MERPALPVDELLPALLASLAVTPVAVLRAEPGAGKTTRVPAALLDSGLCPTGQIVVLQPRRVAARAAAARVASERGGRLGGEVGYAVRMDRKAGPETRLLFVTEGVFLRRLQADPTLEGVGAVVFDEFHERHLDADLALAMLRRLRAELRPELPLLIMSATLPAGPIAEALDAPVFESPGRAHPVEIRYLDRDERRPTWQSVVSAVHALLPGTRGDLLVFLPGLGEIRRVQEELIAADRLDGARTLPLHGELAPAEQDRALAPSDERRVILATNVAETSLTLPGVRTVIDAGLQRSPRHDPATGLDRLELVPISRASADQRAGRAGRLGPGLCLRLWTRAEQNQRPEQLEPEILRLDLSRALLVLLDGGEPDPSSLPWLDAPPAAQLRRASEELGALGALSEGRLTPQGRELARLPLPPRLGALLLAGRRRGVTLSAARAAALLAEREPAGARRGAVSRVGDCDLGDRVAWLARARDGAAARLRQLAERMAKQVGEPRDTSASPGKDLRRAVLDAFPDRVARRREPGSDRALLVGGKGVRLAPQSVVRAAEFFVAVDAGGAARRGSGELPVRKASAIDPGWLDASQIHDEQRLRFEERDGRIVQRERRLYRDLALSERVVGAPRGPRTAECLREAAAERLEDALDLEQPALLRLAARLELARGARPELSWPTLGPPWWRERLAPLCTGRRRLSELREVPLAPVVLAELGHRERETLGREAPDQLVLPNGRSVPLDYRLGAAPRLSIRIQALFGLTETPRLGGGGVPLLLDLLAPNGRTQQLTDDLASFWANTYPQVRKDLRGRYPKHAWPENPLDSPPPPHRKR